MASFLTNLLLQSLIICENRNLEVDGCPSKENLFGQSALLMNATYIVFPKGEP